MTHIMIGWSVAVTTLLLLLLTCASEASPPRVSPSGRDATPYDLLRARLHSSARGPEEPLPLREGEVIAKCLECQAEVDVLKEELALGTSYDVLVEEAILFCAATSTRSLTYCEGYIPLIAPIAYHIMTTNDVDAEDVCGMLLSPIGCNTTNPERDWSIEIHGEKPPVEPIILPGPEEPTLKVLHLADIHMDPLYMPGSNAECDEPLCCREESGDPATPEAEAWYWGDFRHCGSPKWMLEDMFYNIVTEYPDLDYVVWTGDVVPHNMWSTSREYNVQLVKEVSEMMQHFFPDIPIFPVAGNHEMNPLDQYPNPDDSPAELAADWLYQALVTQWSQVVPGLDNSTVLYAGYYSVLFKPGFRIISVNSMFGYSSNIWLAENSHDLGGELAWLEAELGKAEEAEELVHLLGHIPPGLDDGERTWSREYNRIVRRYENIIRGQFFGHTHFDHFEVFHDGDRPIGVAYIAPSQTPWYYLNPAYRIYTIDGDRPDTTRMVLDHANYIMNLTEAHETNVARWYKLYSAKELYNMPSLLPEDWKQLALQMADDRDLFDVYMGNYVSEGEPFLAIGCDDVCYERRLCDVMTSDRNDLDACYGAIKRKRKANNGS